MMYQKDHMTEMWSEASRTQTPKGEALGKRSRFIKMSTIKGSGANFNLWSRESGAGLGLGLLWTSITVPPNLPFIQDRKLSCV